MSLARTAEETLAIIEQGQYESASGVRVDLGPLVDVAVKGTRLFSPAEVEGLLSGRLTAPHSTRPKIEIAAETAAQAARRLVQEQREEHVLLLNFASAKNPGGGFLGGAKAQEEDLARCSALYTCQLAQRAYYEANRATASMLYTDHLIWSPDVPFFRDDHLALLEVPFVVSIITSPAPNAGEALRRNPEARPAIRATLERRAGHVLAVAADRGHRVLVLGAWGCGVFRNDPAEVADVFAQWLDGTRFSSAFDHVVFAIPGKGASERNLAAFRARFDRP